MKTRGLLVVLAFACLSICTPAWSVLHVTPTPGQPTTFDFDWTDCTLNEALQELHTTYGVPTVALIMGNEKFPTSMKPFTTFPELIPSALANDLARDTQYIGKTIVFYPYRLQGVDDIKKLTTSKLLTSLTPQQMDTNASEGGIPYSSLTTEQKKWARDLASVAKTIGARFPEPVFTQRLEQSKLILTMQPKVSIGYTTSRGATGTGISCDTKASADLWKQWAPGQQEAWKLSAAAQTDPGPDAPGTADTTKLAGIYTLKALVGIIQDGCSIPINCDTGYPNLRVAVYCTITKAALARAIALASGGQWKKTDAEWRLKISSLTEMLASHDPTKAYECTKAYDDSKPALLRMVKSGKLKLVADPDWAGPEMVKRAATCGPVDLASLTDAQTIYLLEGYKSNCKSYGITDAPTDLSGLDHITWSPAFGMYIATSNSILYHDWISYK